MSILGKAFDLPMVDDAVSVGQVIAPQVTAFDLPPLSEVANESLAKVSSTFDGAGPFTKTNSSSKTFLEYAAERAGLNKVGNKSFYTPANLTQDQINSFIPSSGVSAASLKRQSMSSSNGKEHMVRLTEQEGIDGSPYTLYFYVMPEVVEARNVSYEAVAPPQFPGAFQKYKGTDSVQWTINATFVCRNTAEATRNLEYLNVLRAWTKPFFGETTGQQYPDKLGAPPPVLILEGFKSKIVGPVPVVITSLNWNWPRDVDYIPAESDGELIPFPTVMQIAIQVVESYSTDEFNKFSLRDYRNGNFSKAFSQLPSDFAARKVSQGSASKIEEAQTIPGSDVATAVASTKSEISKITNDITSGIGRDFSTGGGGDFSGGGASGDW